MKITQTTREQNILIFILFKLKLWNYSAPSKAAKTTLRMPNEGENEASGSKNGNHKINRQVRAKVKRQMSVNVCRESACQTLGSTTQNSEIKD
jgi:hypothetical protein